jgi:hypothetical protein
MIWSASVQWPFLRSMSLAPCSALMAEGAGTVWVDPSIVADIRRQTEGGSSYGRL